MEERTLDGILRDLRITQSELAAGIHMARSTLARKIASGNFTVRDIRRICRFLRLSDPLLVFNIFLREPSHLETVEQEDAHDVDVRR